MSRAARYRVPSTCWLLGLARTVAGRQNAQKGPKSTIRRQSGSAFLCHFGPAANWLVLRSILAENWKGGRLE